MRYFLLFSVAYFALVMLCLAIFGSLEAVDPFIVVRSARGTFATIRANGLLVLAVGIFVVRHAGWQAVGPRLVQVMTAFAALALLIPAYVVVKSHLPQIAGIWANPPFFADTYLAWLDNHLHFGTDPYVVTHTLMGWAGSRWVDVSYGAIWSVVGAFFMLVVAATDGDQQRVVDTGLTYIFVLVVLGNLVALAALSSGPVYYDRLFGTDRFAGLSVALHSAGLDGGFIGNVQSALWKTYEGGVLSAGSGLSAFPSVHVASATIPAVYFSSRARWMLVPAVAYVATIAFLAVHTGYHYAIDSYFSIASVVLFWWFLRRRRARTSGK